jgi:NAD(P)-dependent dehydrogenase (short-subunit alcohol dehydrogenase family)
VGGPLVPRAALVTGAGRGLGRAHALALAALGARVVVNDRDEEPARETVADIEAIGGSAVADTTNVASIAGGRAAVAKTLDAFGRIDIVVNNAGFAHGGGDVESPLDAEIDALLAVHYKAAIGTMSAAFADMKQRRWGRIINTVSEVALDARFASESFGYGAAKAALWSATLSAAVAGAAYGITVNGLSPGARTRLNAELLDAGFRDGRGPGDLAPEHVARVVAYLCTDDAADITGRIIHAAGGEVREYTTTRSSRSPLVERLRSLSP